MAKKKETIDIVARLEADNGLPGMDSACRKVPPYALIRVERTTQDAPGSIMIKFYDKSRESQIYDESKGPRIGSVSPLEPEITAEFSVPMAAALAKQIVDALASGVRGTEKGGRSD
jgi:hypothetical protein